MPSVPLRGSGAQRMRASGSATKSSAGRARRLQQNARMSTGSGGSAASAREKADTEYNRLVAHDAEGCVGRGGVGEVHIDTKRLALGYDSRFTREMVSGSSGEEGGDRVRRDIIWLAV